MRPRPTAWRAAWGKFDLFLEVGSGVQPVLLRRMRNVRRDVAPGTCRSAALLAAIATTVAVFAPLGAVDCEHVVQRDAAARTLLANMSTQHNDAGADGRVARRRCWTALRFASR